MLGIIRDANLCNVMYLDKVPTYFAKGDRRKPVYHSVLARELLASGWLPEQGEATSNFKPIVVEHVEPEIAADEPKDETETIDASEEEPEPVILTQQLQSSFDLSGMTKAELTEFAQSYGIEFKSNITKPELLQICEQAVSG